MERDEARAHWAKSGMTYAVLTKTNLARLRKMIDAAMRESGCLRGTFRAGRAATINGRWGPADIRCQAFYFNDRQAVTFEEGGFIGFAGWADSENVQPILSAFCAWVDETAAWKDGEAEDQEGAGIMSRKGLEFKAAVKLQMFRRAGGPENLRCEGKDCGLPLMGKPFEYDHTVEIWELPEELRREFRKHGVPAEYGKVLGRCCHAPKTARKAGERAKCNKVIKAVAKVKKASRPMPGSRGSKWKKKMDGSVVER